jgi:hypothetical protein
MFRRAPVALHFDGNHLPRLRELADPARPVVGDGHERAVKQHRRLAAAWTSYYIMSPLTGAWPVVGCSCAGATVMTSDI